jgi:ribosomal protein S18 acetylase RimI-like enzyme
VNRELFFLRSSEQRIVTSMVKHAYRLEESNKTLEDIKELDIYHTFYGLTAKDLGLYALVNNEIAGAIWSRRLLVEHDSSAFVDESTPVLSVAVLPHFRGQGIGSFMMEQFLQEASALYDSLSVNALLDSPSQRFYEKFGFVEVESSLGKSRIDNKEILIMKKELERKEIVRPSDGYDASKWMD